MEQEGSPQADDRGNLWINRQYENADDQQPLPHLSEQIGNFAGHVFFGTAGFIILALPALLFSWLAHYLEDTFVSLTVLLVLRYLHYLLLGIDVVTFVAYILVSFYAAAVELLRYVRRLR